MPTATVRTHLPGLFSPEPLKGYLYNSAFMPLTVLGDLLATVKGTTKEWSPVVATAAGSSTGSHIDQLRLVFVDRGGGGSKGTIVFCQWQRPKVLGEDGPDGWVALGARPHAQRLRGQAA